MNYMSSLFRAKCLTHNRPLFHFCNIWWTEWIRIS